MFAKKPSSFHEAAKPIIYSNWFMGLGVGWQPNLSDTANFFMQLYTAIFIPVNWIMIYIGLSVLADITNRHDTSTTAHNTHIMYEALHYTNSCIAVISPGLVWFQRKGLQDYLRKMSNLNETLRAILGSRNEYRKHFVYQICQIIGIFFVTICVCISDIPWMVTLNRSLLENIGIQVTLHYPIIVLLMLDMNFCSLVLYLRRKFQNLNEGLLLLAENPSAFHPGKKIFVASRKASQVSPRPRVTDTYTGTWTKNNHDLLHETRKVHLELCELSRRINYAFGIQNLVSMSTSFVMVTGLLYTIYSSANGDNLAGGEIKGVIPTALWAVIYAFKIWIVNHSCWSVSNEASRSGEIIYEFLELSVDKEFQRQIQEFGVQMLQNPVQFNACGFFTLDYSFVQGVIGSVTTYLVILIQMS